MVNAKCNLWVTNVTHSKWMIPFMCKGWQFKRCENFTNMFKYKYETLNCCVYFNIYTNKCNMQHLNNDFNKFKVDGSTHVKMLIV